MYKHVDDQFDGEIPKFKFNPRGKYDPEAHYDYLDIVGYNNTSYIVRQECQGITPTNGEYYLMIANGIPSGLIIAWNGNADNIPYGWKLCDGSNDTPDLRGRFIIGEDNSFILGSIGGKEDITLTKDQLPSHSHTSALSLSTNATGEHNHSISMTGLSADSAGAHNHSIDISKLSIASGGSHTHTVAGSAFSATSNGNHSHSMNTATSVTTCSGTYTVGSSRQYLVSASFTAVVSDNTGAHTHTLNGNGTAASNGAHTHSVTGSISAASAGCHTHTISGDPSATSAGKHSHSVSGTMNIAANGGGSSIIIMPPYYALCWIMKA